MPGRRERKVVTVLFADLVGFTSRSEQLDPEDVAEELGSYHSHVREELERYGGTVEKFIGDAVMAVFGAPVAHEDDPERAVRAALGILAWAEEEGIEMRIGVNTGEVVVGTGERLATGDAVNVAARLQQGADPDEILLGDATHELVRGAVDAAPVEPLVLKGKAERVAAHKRRTRGARARARRAVRRARARGGVDR